MLLVDTSVLVDVLEDDPDWAAWSARQLRAQALAHELFINPVICSELSVVFDSLQALDEAIESMGLSFRELPRPALFLAGRAFVRYRRQGGSRSGALADFFIGAHAAVLDCGIVTRDTQRYRSYFPRLRLISPE